MSSLLNDLFAWSVFGIPAFLAVITVVVFFHELGHFSVARFFGVTVEAFSIGFGREIFGWNDRHGTRWKVSYLPLGGYVKFAGDANVASAPDEETLREMDSAERAGVLHFKPLYQRALVVAAGPIANFILAAVIFAGLTWAIGKPVTEPVVTMFTENSAAAEAGMLIGDEIVSVDGHPVDSFSEFAAIIRDGGGAPVDIDVLRSRAPMTFRITPRLESIETYGMRASVYRVGVGSEMERAPVGVLEALVLAVDQVWTIVSTTMGYLGSIVFGDAPTDQLAGPIGIANIAGNVAQEGLIDLIQLTALISVSIGLINLFPIPVLDGGHLLYYAFEAALGRPLGERAQEVGFRLGLVVVLSLMLFATFNDLVRFNLF
jgi:regulator of sigma E protease